MFSARQWRIQELLKGAGRTTASARSTSLNGGLRAELPAGSKGSTAPGGGQVGKAPEVEIFMSIFIQKGPKVKDLNENSPRFAQPGPALSFGQWGAAARSRP